MPDGFTEERKNIMLIQRFIPGFRALIFQMGIFSHFALALAGAAGLGLAEDAVAGGLQARAGFAPRQGCVPQGPPDGYYDTTRPCRDQGGDLQAVPDEDDRWICSNIDINDTFCIVGSKDALPCAGLYKHVECCNHAYDRPALDPFHCAAACPGGHKAVGRRCVVDQEEVRDGYVFDLGPIPLVASHVGELLRVTATVANGRVEFELPPPLALSATGDQLVAAVNLPPGPDLQGTQRALTEHPATLRAQFFKERSGVEIRSTLVVFTVTALAKREPIVVFQNPADVIPQDSPLPTYGHKNLSYALAGASSMVTLIGERNRTLQLRPLSQVGQSLVVTLLAADPGAFLGALRLTVSLLFDCQPLKDPAPPHFFAYQNPNYENAARNADLARTAGVGDFPGFCDALRRGGSPTTPEVYPQLFEQHPLPPGVAHILERMLSLGALNAAQRISLTGQTDDTFHDYPLHIVAAQNGAFVPLARNLMRENQYVIYLQGYLGRTALMIAAEAATAGEERMFDYVLDNTPEGYLDYPQIPSVIVMETREIACPPESSRSVCSMRAALHYAAEADNPYRIGRLREKGADLNAEDRDRRTPLHLAVIAGNAAAVRALVELGAVVNARDKDEYAPIHYAVDSTVEVVCALFSRDADFQKELETPDGHTAGKIAEDNNKRELARHLQDPGECFRD